MRNILFILFLFWSCTSCNSNSPENDSDTMTDSDSDLLADVDIVDEDTENDDSEEDIDDDIPYERPDFEEPDEDFADKTCLPVPETGDELCFWPRSSDELCSLPDRYFSDQVLSRDLTNNYNVASVDLSEKYYYFTKGNSGTSRTVYRCNRSDGSVKVIFTSTFPGEIRGALSSFSIDNELVVFSYLSETMSAGKNQACYLGTMNGDWELKRIAGFENDCYEPRVVWPYVVYREEYPGWLHIYDIRTGTEKKLEGYKVYSFHHDGKKAYINAIVGTGDEYIGGDIFSKGFFRSGIWEVDLETLEVKPVEIFLLKSTYAPFVYGSYLIYSSRREWMLYSGDFMAHNGMAVVLFDLVNRTERILTDTVTGNNGRGFINYPYAGWVDGDHDDATAGYQKVVNLETDDEWMLDSSIKYMQDLTVMKDYSMIYLFPNGVCVAEFPDPGKVESNEGCHDVNPCTDDIYSVKLQKCTNPPNMKKCDDGDPDTPLDVCTDGKCKGYQIVADAAEMIKIPAGAYYMGDYAPPIENVDPDERPWEGWKDTPPELTLPEYSIDKYEVVQKDYRECVDSGICRAPVKNRSGWRFDYWGNSEYDNYPVLYVDYYEAEKYCLWRGKRLPTEYEWVKAANGGEKKWYPWGDDDPDSENRYGNIFYSLNETTSYDTAEVGTYKKDISPYGVMDMNGNVSEWTASDWTDYLDTEPVYGDSIKVVKGGRWEETSNYSGWIAQRMGATPWTSSNSMGFRCVKDLK